MAYSVTIEGPVQNETMSEKVVAEVASFTGSDLLSLEPLHDVVDSDALATVHTYELTCKDCAFETSVEGRFLDALDVADAQQEKHGDPLTKPFVNLKRSDTSK